MPSDVRNPVKVGSEVTVLVDAPDRPRMGVLVASGPIRGRSPGQV